MSISATDAADPLQGDCKAASPPSLPQALRPAIIDYEAHPYISPVFNQIAQEERDRALEAFLPAFLSDVKSALRKGGFGPPPQKSKLVRAFGRMIAAGGKLAARGARSARTADRAVFDRLWKDGAVSFHIPPAQKSELVRALGPMIAATDRKLTAKGGKRMVHADIRTDFKASEQPEVMEIINGILADSGILQMVAVYCGKPATVKHLSLMINRTANMESIFGTYYEEAWGFRPQKMPKAVYYHVDSMPGCPFKTMLYVSDVGPDNGPFQYVMGSARAADPLDLLIRKRTDTLGFSHRQIMALPRELRRKSHFGFDLPDETPETDAYLAHEKSFCSSEGDLILFDANGIHRGGMATKERRVALQMLLT